MLQPDISDAILSFNNNIKYIICDIPPSIFTSYIRLKKRFPNKKIVFANEFKKEKLQKSIRTNDVTLIFPDQLKQIDQNYINIVLAIDCLHEMEIKNLEFYFKHVDRIALNFYFSVWKKTTVPHSFSFKNLSRTNLYCNKYSNNYPKLKNFRKVFSKDLIFPATQIGVGYRKK